MMKFPDWGLLFKALAKAGADLKANAPRPVPPPATGAEILADIDELEAALPAIKAWLAANPGSLTALDDLLDALAAQGVEWAAAVRAGVDAAPGAVSEASAWLPRLRGFLAAIQPVPTWQPGPGQYRGR